MDLIRTVFLSLVLAFLTYIGTYALFSLFTILGFFWSLLILFLVYLFLVSSMPHSGNGGQIIIAQRAL